MSNPLWFNDAATKKLFKNYCAWHNFVALGLHPARAQNPHVLLVYTPVFRPLAPCRLQASFYLRIASFSNSF
jgi:hypothetical protein